MRLEHGSNDLRKFGKLAIRLVQDGQTTVGVNENRWKGSSAVLIGSRIRVGRANFVFTITETLLDNLMIEYQLHHIKVITRSECEDSVWNLYKILPHEIGTPKKGETCCRK